MLRRLLVVILLVASLLALVACGGGSGLKATGTKTLAKSATKQRTSTPTRPITGTPSATEPSGVGAPTEPPAATRPPPPAVEQPTDTPAPGPSAIDVGLVEFAVRPALGSAPAGALVFAVHNDGTTPHNFLVIKSDLSSGALPQNSSTQTVDESQVDVIGRIPNIDQEDSAQLPLELAAGHYVLICNLPAHYSAGMHVSFTVQ